jgi:hypothetical protein
VQEAQVGSCADVGETPIAHALPCQTPLLDVNLELRSGNFLCQERQEVRRYYYKPRAPISS